MISVFSNDQGLFDKNNEVVSEGIKDFLDSYFEYYIQVVKDVPRAQYIVDAGCDIVILHIENSL